MGRLSVADADWLAILHAGACGNDTACVVMPAATASGKSTLTTALMRSGLRFFSDDSAAIDRTTLQVVALPFALMLREGSWRVLAPYVPDLSAAPILERNGDRVRFLAPSSMVQSGRVTPKCLLFVQYQQGASPNLRKLTAFESLLGLQQSGFWLPHEERTIRSFLSWVQSMPSFHLTYSSLGDAIPIVHNLLRADLTAEDVPSESFLAAPD
jgi:hypothetical protein